MGHPPPPQRRTSSSALHGSLRDLILSSEKSDDDDDNDSNGDYDDPSDGGPNDFNKIINLSRSKFADTKFRTRNIYGTGLDDVKGMHRDRLSTFSFSSRNTRSASEGGGWSRGEEDVGDVVSASEEEVEEAMEGDASAVVSKEEMEGVPDDIMGETVMGRYEDANNRVNDPYNMVGIHYSKRKHFPDRKQDETSEEDSLTGLHKDRLSTFSFSSNQAVEKSRSSTSSKEVDEEEVAAVDEKASRPPIDKEKIDELFGVDNFHNLIDIDRTRTSSPVTRQDPQTPDGQTNHADRLSTYSLSSKEEEKDSLSSTSFGKAGPGRKANHDDRLGTFSFASTDPQSGSTTSGGTNPTNPLPSTRESKITTIPTSSNTKHSNSNPISSDRTPNNSNNSDQIDQVYTSPQKGSLSSLASSVSIKTRNDRIDEVRARTDPKAIHPDGMNTPRLNREGEVMSFSSTSGRPNIFQRIQDNVAASAGGGEEGTAEGVGGGVVPEESEADNERVDDTLDNGDCFIGFDLGTSGARMSIVEKKLSEDGTWEYDEVFASALAWDEELQYDDAEDWRAAIDALMLRAEGPTMAKVKAVCVSGTSATCLLVKKGSLEVSRSARMYNYDISSSSDSSAVERAKELIDRYVPEKHTARANTGSLAKLLLWIEEQSVVDENGEAKEALCHQSDYVSMSLMHEGLTDTEKQCTVTSDWHNCLKLGYDVQNREFPAWMHKLLNEGAGIADPESILPSRVISPGEPFGVLSPAVATKFGLSSNVMLVGGTTDSNAAFFAAAGAQPEAGTAVTSLGSTLAIKQLSTSFVEDASRGVYSHRFPRFGKDGDEAEGEDDEAWLIGGASNVGCAILRQEGFSNEELAELSAEIDPASDSPLSYYPLMKKGERFPVADSDKEPVLTPKPDSRKEYLHGILQGIGDVERDGFRILGDLGASPDRPTVVLSCGGGSKNDVWISMRERRLKDICAEGREVQVKRAENTEASYGAALLAAASFEE